MEADAPRTSPDSANGPLLPPPAPTGSSAWSEADLQQRVCDADPAVRFVLPRVLRRVIKERADLPALGLRIPHRKSLVIGREPLLEIVDRSEFEGGQTIPPRVILLPRPTGASLSTAGFDDVLLYYWRLLFHAKVHAVLDEARLAGTLSEAVVNQRIGRIGTTEFDEIRLVLQQDGFLLPPVDSYAMYSEFAAVYLELKHFSPSFLPCFFPGIRHADRVEAILSEDLDAAALFHASRPAGAPLPVDSFSGAAEQWAVDLDEAAPAPWKPVRTPSEGAYLRLVRLAETAASTGNVVGSAIYRARAEQHATASQVTSARQLLKSDLDRLVRRLLVALESPEREPRPWREPLLALVLQTPRGPWTAEARLLYDLQKVCVDHEREVSTVDLVEWALSLGRRPIRRPLPYQRNVLVSKHLHSALRRLATVRLSDVHRRRLSELLRQAAAWAESRLRMRYRPLIVKALDEVRLLPRNLPEHVARDKLVEELLDRVVERGFLTISDLRDAVSRNSLKLPDCIEAQEPGRRAATRRKLGRVYQATSRLAGRRIGLGLTRWVASPLFRLFGAMGSLLGRDPLLRADRRLAVLLDGVYHRAEIYLRLMLRVSSWGFGTRTGRFLTRFLAVPFGGAYVIIAGFEHLVGMFAGHGHEPALGVRAAQVAVLGLVLLGLLHSARFRRIAWRWSAAVWHGVRFLLVDVPRWLSRLPAVLWLLRSRGFRLAVRFVFKPLLFTLAAWALLPLERVDWRDSAILAGAIFLTANLLLNSRLGRNLEEATSDWLTQTWRRFGVRLFTGLFWMIVDAFRWLLETIERVLYSVDEWLRFRSGETRLALASKAVLGLFWFWVTYLVRFCVNLLIEPQINPIKHFPVVTVSHKLLLGFIPHLAGVFMQLSVPAPTAWPLATAIIWSIPGIAGFLVWELKENWRLYAANRPTTLRPVPIGHHGETMLRLLRLGFHSGTIPKRYAKLRRAERKARANGKWQAVRKNLLALEHVESAVRRFVEREMLGLLGRSRLWQHQAVAIHQVHLAVNRVSIDLVRPDSNALLRIATAIEGAGLASTVGDDGFSANLAPRQQDTLAATVLGLEQQVGAAPRGGAEWVLLRDEVTWAEWVAAWQADQAGLNSAGKVLRSSDGNERRGGRLQ